MGTVTVKTNPENPEPVEVIADSIIRVADAAQRLLSSRLTNRAVILLLHDACNGNVNKKQIQIVLEQAAALRHHYLKTVKK